MARSVDKETRHNSTTTGRGAETPETAEDLNQTFRWLADQWGAETALISSVTRMATHPAYQRIIGLGLPAVPLLLRELQERPDHWFWALNAITGEDPTGPDDDFEAATAAWLRWGRQAGYLT